MAINEEYRQLEIIRELEEQARRLTHSTRTVPNPPDSYDMLAELGSVISLLKQVVSQLKRWHLEVVDGQHYQGEDERGDGTTGTLKTAHALERATTALNVASEAIQNAHSANGVIRWIGKGS